jgi:hypothetical protein
MKPFQSAKFQAAPLLIFAALTACVSAAPSENVLPDRVQVSWAPSDQLSEVRDNPAMRGPYRQPEDWQRMLSAHLRKRADAMLPPGEHLDVTIDNIKLAGDYEPWRGPNLQDVRIMKDVYPPRIDLHYRLLAADGTTIRDGKDKMLDMAYLQQTLPVTSDPLRYDKRLIDEWLRKEFGPPRGS